MTEKIPFGELDGKFIFKTQPNPICGDLRPFWRIGLIVLMLDELGHGGAASLEKVHVINWALRSEESRNTFMRIIENGLESDDCIVRFEPALNRALQFASQEKIIELRTLSSGGMTMSLTEQGRKMAASLNKIDDIYSEEKVFFSRMKGKVSQQNITKLLNWR